MILSRLIQDYCNHEKITLADFARRLGFHYKIVWNWYHEKHFPNQFSAACILQLFKQGIDEKIHREYEAAFWHIWTFEKQIVDSRVKNKLANKNTTDTERLLNAC